MKYAGRDLRVSFKVAGEYKLLPGERASAGTYGNEQVDTTTKDDRPWRALTAVGTRFSDITASGVVRDDLDRSVWNALMAAVFNGTELEVMLESANGLVAAGLYMTPSLSRTGEHNGAEVFDVSFNSSGEVIRVLPLPPAPIITSALLQAFNFDKPFSYQITASNGPTAFAASPLPSGLSVDTGTGLISGTPVASEVLPWLGYWDLTTAGALQLVDFGAQAFTYYGARSPASFDSVEAALRFDPAAGTEWMGCAGITPETVTALTIGMRVKNLELAAALAILEVGPTFDSVEVGVSGNSTATYFNVVTSPSGDQAFPDAPILSDNGWHWVVMSVDFSTKAVKLYVDGVLYSSLTSVYAHASISIGAAFIHCWNNQKSLVKNVFVVKRVLDASTIARLSAGAQPGSDGRLDGRGPFDILISASNAGGSDTKTLRLVEQYGIIAVTTGQGLEIYNYLAGQIGWRPGPVDNGIGVVGVSGSPTSFSRLGAITTPVSPSPGAFVPDDPDHYGTDPVSPGTDAFGSFKSPIQSHVRTVQVT